MAASPEQARINGRKGGRPKGAIVKPRFADYLKPGDLEAVILKAIEMAKVGDQNMIKLVMEHSLGKPITPMDLTSGGKNINVIIPPALAEAFKINAEPNKEARGSNTK